ncbi:MAG: NAD+ synthase [Chloroflexi bacterium]|nr:NAD+ synthase [Chloroflexota bacterium]
MRSLRLAMAQINTTVGDLEGNARRILQAVDQARALGVDLVAFPEMALPGYPVEDLLLKPQFIQDNLDQLHRIVAQCRGITAVIGYVDKTDDIYNAAAIVHDGKLVGVYHKQYLPNYGVFDENRYFQAGTEAPVYTINGVGIGVNICEDIWYPTGPAALQALGDAEVIVNINASPYHMGKGSFRERMVATRAADSGVIVAYVNLVGGQDELVFDGGSFVCNERGDLLARGALFQEDLVVADLDVEAVFRTRLHDPRRRKERLVAAGDPHVPHHLVAPAPDTPRPKSALPARSPLPEYDRPAEVYHALTLGLRDYLRKNGFQKVALGLSGGIDSSLTAAIAADALGKENVVGVAMPSRYSSEGSLADARRLAEALDIRFMVIAIEEVFSAYLHTLEEPFAGTQPNVAEENVQARIRGNLLMALSNKFGWLVLTTGNKSETATGYTTLYGDMAGGFAVIKDVPKTLVYQLARYRNTLGDRPVIPESVFTKVPSAELRPNQSDQDTLPPYDLLDQVLQAYVEEDRSYEELLALGFSEAVVRQVIRLVDGAEYKRRQAPPGIKITPRAFGRDRRLPIVNRYRSY